MCGLLTLVSGTLSSIMKGDLDTQTVEIGQVRPHPKNVRQGDIGAISESLKAHGQYRAIVVQRSTGHILAGNHTWKAAKALGWKEISAHFIDCDDDAAMRILLADNRANDLATYDDAALAAVLAELNATDLGLAGTLFDGDALDDLIADIGREEQIADAPDDAPAITQIGDIWLLGDHRLMCGDSSLTENLDRLMNGKKAGCVLTDPPYGINLDTDYSQGGAFKGRKYRAVLNDDKPFDAASLSAYFTEVAEQFWWGADYYRQSLPYTELEGSWLVWDKRVEEAKDALIGSAFELCWSRQRHARRILRHQWTNWTSHHNQDHKREHPTEKPIGMLKEIITRWCDDHAIIVDPFAGSGSTLIAAHLTNRTCYTMELDPHYCDIICARYQKQTGNLPLLEATGETHNFLP
jgi:DNA modification methylase